MLVRKVIMISCRISVAEAIGTTKTATRTRAFAPAATRTVKTGNTQDESNTAQAQQAQASAEENAISQALLAQISNPLFQN